MATSKQFILFTIGIIAACSIRAQDGDGKIKMKFNGFGDVVLGKPFGNPANIGVDSLYRKYGDQEYPHGMHNGFRLQGIDLLHTVYLNDDITVQSELNLQGSRGNEASDISLDIERIYIDYKINEGLGLQTWMIFTPIGYINRNLYSRAWLMNSIYVYTLVEEDAGLVPSHMVGANIYGTFTLGGAHALRYMLGIGMPRPMAPRAEIFNTSLKGYQATAFLEWQIPGPKDFRIGLSGYSNEVHTCRVDSFQIPVDITSSSAPELIFQENGFNPYLNYSGKIFNFLAEYHYVFNETLYGNYPSGTALNSLSAELSFNASCKGKRLAPYVRYDFIRVPSDGGAYYGLRQLSDETLTKVYVPNLYVGMVGIAYDLTHFNRIKLEYVHHFDGPWQSDGVFLQTAFGF